MINSRISRRNKCGFKGEGTKQWNKTTEYGEIESEIDFSYKNKLINFCKSRKIGKHAGSHKSFGKYSIK